MEYFNEMEVVFDSRSENEGFARVAVAAFMTQMDPVLEEVADVKTAVSEAVTNSIIHGYEGRTSGKITVWCGIEKDKKTILVTVKDQGIGIENVEQAMEPLYTTRPDMDRSGMGFAFMIFRTDTTYLCCSFFGIFRIRSGLILFMMEELLHSIVRISPNVTFGSFTSVFFSPLI